MSDQVRYPGYIMRQSLVSESQKRVSEYQDEADSLWESMNKKGLDQESKQTLSESYAMMLGKIKAMRDINEWAKEHTAPNIPNVAVNKTKC